ncbi:MAG: GNAT family N-acetyltransferase [Lachnospiraceae bacterium]|nr:GNAT family N-acetyltransferase [Lachnospiraceae bacterium]
MKLYNDSKNKHQLESVSIRSLKQEDYSVLKDFLYEAIFIPDGVTPPPNDIIYNPELKLYYEDFGKGKSDYGFVACKDDKIIGAVWVRIMNDYGHIDDDTPSFAISLYKEYRGMGIGTALMDRMLRHLKNEGYKKASLAVQKANYAVRMYEKLGFKTVDENEEEFIMVYELNEM